MTKDINNDSPNDLLCINIFQNIVYTTACRKKKKKQKKNKKKNIKKKNKKKKNIKASKEIPSETNSSTQN